MSSNEISLALGRHYAMTFKEHGASPEGVDWGVDPRNHQLRLDQMLHVVRGNSLGHRASLLDVGCGFGSLLDRAKELSVAPDGFLKKK